MTSEVAERYAQGLFEAAQEDGSVESKRRQVLQLLEVLEKNPDFLLFLKAVRVTREEKKQMICSVFGEFLDADMIHFLELLVDRSRTTFLHEMLERYLALANEDLGIVTATVESARKLTEEDMKRIQDALARETGRQVILRNRISPSVIAGIKVTVGNRVTDITMKSRIENMRQILLKGGRA